MEGPYVMVAKVEQRGNAAILKKFGRKIGGKAHVTGHVLQKKDAATGETGDVPAKDAQQGSEYLAVVGIGTPAQNMTLDFDTGSSDLWVFSTDMSASELQSAKSAGHTIFDPSKSSTWKNMSGSTWQIEYGDGSSASGVVGTDDVNLGGLIIKNQAVELAQQISSEFAQDKGDGLLGLAFPKLNTVQPTPVDTPVENMIKQGDIPKNAELFTAHLALPTGNSFYTFGYIDQTALGGATPTYTPVDTTDGFWMFDSTSASVNGQTISRTGNKAIADTGTTLCLVGDNLLEKVYGAIQGAQKSTTQQGWVFPTSSAIPQIQLAVGSTLFTLNPEDMKFQDLGDGTYYGGMQSRGDQDFDIFGDVFLRSIYAIFDQGNKRFGAVQRQPNTTAASGSSGTAPAAPSGSSSLYPLRPNDFKPYSH
ncbi:MAG: hypothetical protein FE78DRAFT_536830 [Acidomyces sp. 'richmondensis']|nr:MAG: hypothetical protein FE78DRAFT_536830 [Acidomyces sp. 'richmondensis']